VYTADYIILALLGLAGFWYYVRRRPRIAGEAFNRETLRGTLRRAADWLEEQGYTVLLSRPTARLVMQGDRRAMNFRVQADFLVRRQGRQYVVVLKRGRHWGARLSNRRVRQRLLEYQFAFWDRPLLVVDLERQNARVVHFRCLPR